MRTPHEVIFYAVNEVYREPKLSLDAANAVLEELDAHDYVIVDRPPAGAEEAAVQPRKDQPNERS